jgi:Uma2 family endonuclease
MTPTGDGHIGRVNSLTYLFIRKLNERVVVSPQNPIRLSDMSEPQPDLVLLRPRSDFYGTSKAKPEDVLLLIEIAKSSLDYDRTTKLPRYAAAGIPEVWIVNLADDQLEVYRKPGEGGYGERIVLVRGDRIAPQSLLDLVLRVDEILG